MMSVLDIPSCGLEAGALIFNDFNTPRTPCRGETVMQVPETPCGRSYESIISSSEFADTFKTARSTRVEDDVERINPFYPLESNEQEKVNLTHEVAKGLSRRFHIHNNKAPILRFAADGSPVYKLRHSLDGMFYAVKVTEASSANPLEVKASSLLRSSTSIAEYHDAWETPSYVFTQFELTEEINTPLAPGLREPLCAAILRLHKLGFTHNAVSKKAVRCSCSVMEVKISDFSKVSKYSVAGALKDLEALEQLFF
eukprot:TRINITY_DN3251_c0_g1_i3.p1 TRINITY_DN3251_c0_g1~~TRINITY_DN3251_c0_g1_i3.p1  ORF type:complete len:274 (+),score=37.22 TRINITY_DN3251_c0_g1_i3:59-823(+)